MLVATLAPLEIRNEEDVTARPPIPPVAAV